MQFLPIAAEVLRVLTSPPARHQIAARTILWGCAGLFLMTAGVFALIGLHAALSAALDPVAASFIIAAGLVLLAGLVGLGAWLAGPSHRDRVHPEFDAAILLAGFLEGFSGRTDAAEREKEDPAQRDH